MKFEIVQNNGLLKGKLKHAIKEHSRIFKRPLNDNYIQQLCDEYANQYGITVVDFVPFKKKAKRIKGVLWQDLRRKLFETKPNHCAKCKSTENLEADHIYPVSLFPEKQLDLSNLQILCKKCNYEKSNKYIIAY